MMTKRGITIYTIFKKKFKQYAYPKNLLSLKELKVILGQTFHVPKEDLFIVIKDLVEHKVLKPTTEKQWQHLEVV